MTGHKSFKALARQTRIDICVREAFKRLYPKRSAYRMAAAASWGLTYDEIDAVRSLWRDRAAP